MKVSERTTKVSPNPRKSRGKASAPVPGAVSKVAAMLPVLTSIRTFFWSPTRLTVWPRMYREPVIIKKDQEQLHEEEKKELSFAPIKAAPNAFCTSVFYDPVIARLESLIVRQGKRHVAREILHKTFFEVKRIQLAEFKAAKTDEERAEVELNPIVITKKALENIQPCVITKKIKRGGATYHVPHAIGHKYAQFLAMKWLLDTLRDRPKPKKERLYQVLSKELLLAAKNEGKVFKKKEDVHKLAEQNRAYAHYRWG